MREKAKAPAAGPSSFKEAPMKKIFILALAALLPSQAEANVLKEAILEVLQERLEKTIDKDFKDSEYWTDLLENVANGTPETVVQQIMDDYDPQAFAKDTGLKLLEKLVPEAAGPIGLLLLANDAVYQYTNYMLDFYKDMHMRNFADAVLKPSKTRKELKANYDKFVEEYVNSGMSDTNVLYSERKAMENKYHDAFLQAFAKIAKAERAMEARESAKKIASRKFRIMRSEAKAAAEGAAAYLEAAGMPASASNIKIFVRNSGNNDFALSVRRAADEAAKKAEERKPQPPPAAEKPKDKPQTTAALPADKKPAQPEPPKVTVPAQPGGGPIGASLALKKRAADDDSSRVLDYSRHYAAYKSAADQMVFGDLPPSVFEEAASNVMAAAAKDYANCLGHSQPDKGKMNECLQAHNRFGEDIGRIRENLNDLAGKLAAELNAYPQRMRTEATPAAQLAKQTALIAQDAKTAETGTACSFGIEYRTAEEGTKSVQDCKTYIGFLDSYINRAEAAAREFQDFARDYDARISAQYAAYADRYASSYGLAAFAGLRLDSAVLKTLLDDSARAQNSLADPRAPLGEGSSMKLRRRLSYLMEDNREKERQLDLNRAFLAKFTTAAEEAQKACVVQRKSGGPLDLRVFDLSRYYEDNFRSLFTDFFSGAFGLLGAKGHDPAENMSYRGEPMLVWQASKYSFYKSLKGHEEVLAGFDEKLSALRELGLENRLETLDRHTKAAEAALGGIKSLTKDSTELRDAFRNAGPALRSLADALRVDTYARLIYGGEYTLSVKALGEARNAYAGQVEKIKTIEKNMISVFTKYTTADPQDANGNYHRDLMDARTDMNCKRWECSSEVWEAYKTMTAAQEKRSVNDHRKFSPISALALNGRAVPQRSSLSIELSEKELEGGEIRITGALHPGTAGSIARLGLSLDGQTYPVQLPASDKFSYSFRPEEGRRYYISVKPELSGVGRAEPWPADGDYFSVEYVKGGQDEVKAFYDKFRAAYEGRNAGAVMNLVSPDWSSGDEVGDFQELESSLRASFRLYDEIKYSVTGLKAESLPGGSLRACYEAAITSRIFKRNLKHEEKSSVCEELREEGGKLRIVRTLSGRYWSAQ